MPPRSISNDEEKRRRAVFDRVIRLPEAERATAIERETAGDPAFRASILRLVAASQADTTGVLDRRVCERQPAPGATLPSSIGGYPVIRCLGAGGMGKVYLCREPQGSGLVAVKLLNVELQSRTFLQRFENERVIQSRLQHPNVCRLLGAGTTEHGVPFIVMEHVAGEHIDIHCRRVGLAAVPCLRLFSQVLAGVEYFHRQQIVHRDLKPSNILVNTAGNVKILDFGVARIVEHPPGFTGHGATSTTLPIMTISYASPEQLGKRVSGRSSDIYSLGVLLYELLTGQHPFAFELRQGRDALVAAMASTLPIPPSGLPGGLHAIPKDADNMVLKALRFDPGRRYRFAGQFLEDLRGCLEDR